MTLQIITADQRLAQVRRPNVALFGPSGIGKTFQARTLPDAGRRCLFQDLEAGTLSINRPAIDRLTGRELPPVLGDGIDVRQQALVFGKHPWEMARALICWLGGPDPAAARLPDESPTYWYGQQQYETYCAAFGAPAQARERYDYLFIDSITVAGRHAFSRCHSPPKTPHTNR